MVFRSFTTVCLGMDVFVFIWFYILCVYHAFCRLFSHSLPISLLLHPLLSLWALTSLVLNFLWCPPCLLISLNISHLLVFLSWNLSDFFRSNSPVIPRAVSSMLITYHFSNYIFLLEELNGFLGKSTWSSEVVSCHQFCVSSFYIPQSLHTEFIPISKVFGI